ncbi:hypothetical protein D9M70_341640 [compost metagenome]
MSKQKPTLKPDQVAECEALNAIYLSRKKELKLTQKMIADVMGIKPPSVFGYLNGKIPLNAKAAATFADLLQVPVSAFSRRLSDEIDRIAKSRTASLNGGNVESAPHPIRSFTYPVLDWSQIEGAMEVVAKYQAGQLDLPSQSSETYAGRGAHWLVVKSDIMVSPSGVSFPEGLLILVAPSMKAEDGQYVIARLKDTGETAFRQLRRDAGLEFLRPLNPAYPTIQLDDRWEIVSTVVGAKYPETIFK